MGSGREELGSPPSAPRHGRHPVSLIGEKPARLCLLASCSSLNSSSSSNSTKRPLPVALGHQKAVLLAGGPRPHQPAGHHKAVLLAGGPRPGETFKSSSNTLQIPSNPFHAPFKYLQKHLLRNLPRKQLKHCPYILEKSIFAFWGQN